MKNEHVDAAMFVKGLAFVGPTMEYLPCASGVKYKLITRQSPTGGFYSEVWDGPHVCLYTSPGNETYSIAREYSKAFLAGLGKNVQH